MKWNLLTDIIEYKKGTFLEHKQLSSTVLYLIEGTITVSINTPNGKTVPLRYINPKEFFGLSLLNTANENISFLTTSNVCISCIDRGNLFYMINNNYDFFSKYMNFLDSRIDFLMEKVILFSIQNNKQRLSYFFLNQVKKQNKNPITLNMSKTHILEYLGISRGSFYRELNSLISDKSITVLNGNTYLCNIDLLENSFSC
jgi:CRP-like cAMP-binding protein